MFLVAMQYRQAITRAPFVTVSYTPSVVPVMVLGRPAQPVGAVTCEVCPAGAGIPAFDSPDRSLGTGVIPAELELTFGGDAALTIVWGGGIGFLWVDDAVGNVSARRFNVLATARFGLRADLSRLGTLDLGARLQHLSHGGTVEQPGVSLVVWSVGWSPW